MFKYQETFEERNMATKEYITNLCKERPIVRQKIRFNDTLISVCQEFNCP
jgi:hypothetical protein